MTQHLSEPLPESANFIRIFSDGSCNYKTRIGSYAARIAYDDGCVQHVWGHLDDVTNNIAELKGIYHGLAAVPDAVAENARVTLLSDSEWAIRCITGVYSPQMYHDHPVITWKMIHEQASRFKSITWQHTKGHAGTLENEECDSLCSYAATSVEITDMLFDHIMAAARKKSNAG